MFLDTAANSCLVYGFGNSFPTITSRNLGSCQRSQPTSDTTNGSIAIVFDALGTVFLLSFVNPILESLPVIKQGFHAHAVFVASLPKQSGSSMLESVGARGKPAEVLAGMIRRATVVAVDPDRPLAERVEAVRSLGLAPLEEAAEILPELLESRQPQDVQIAVLRTFARSRDPQVAELIVAAWGSFSPRVRGEAAEALLARPDRLSVLLDAIEDAVILPSQLDPARIHFLTTHADSQIKQRAQELFGDVKLARREEGVAAYRDALELAADRTRGQAVFERECSTCHRLEGVGFDLGLPLATVQSRGREGILSQILDPNREVNPAYLNYTVVTDGGLTVTGMITAETANSITLCRAEGESDTILRTDIDQLQSSGLSIMPEGLEKQITKQEIADLIEYLMSIP